MNVLCLRNQENEHQPLIEKRNEELDSFEGGAQQDKDITCIHVKIGEFENEE